MMDPRDPGNMFIHGKAAVNWVMEICIKESIVPRFEITSCQEDPRQPPVFQVICTVTNFNNKTFVATEEGRNKKDAKQRAAIAMLNTMGFTPFNLFEMLPKKPKEISTYSTRYGQEEEDDSEFVPLDPQVAIEKQYLGLGKVTDPNILSKTKIDAELLIDLTKNSISELKFFCSDQSIAAPTFELIQTDGPAHARIFTMSCEIKDNCFPEPMVVTKTMCTSQQKLKHHLSSIMLNMLKDNTDKLINGITKRTSIQEEKEGNLISFCAKLKKSDGDKGLCSIKHCLELIGHRHHELQKKLCGKVVTALNNLVLESELNQKNSIKIMEDFCKEQNTRGNEATTTFHVYEQKGATGCFLEFTFKDVSFTKHGQGFNEDEAKSNAALKMLEFLSEISLKN